MSKRKTPGERIASKHVPRLPFVQEAIAPAIDRAIRRAQAEGYDRCLADVKANGGTYGMDRDTNPYRGRRK